MRESFEIKKVVKISGFTVYFKSDCDKYINCYGRPTHVALKLMNYCNLSYIFMNYIFLLGTIHTYKL